MKAQSVLFFRSGYLASLGVDSCTEELASKVMAESLYSNYARGLYERMQSDGIDMATVKQNHFDAFLSLASAKADLNWNFTARKIFRIFWTH